MKINRIKLIEALQAVNVGLANKEVIEQSTCYVFLKKQVVTYNDEIAVSFPFDIGFEGAVPAKELFAIVNKVKSEEIEFNFSDSELILKGSKAKAGLRVQSDINLPIESLAQPENDDWKALPENFCEAIKFCLFSVSRDQTKPVLNCVHVNGKFIESTDNYRITKYDMKAKGFKEELLIPASSAKHIIAYSPKTFAKTEGWLHFKNDKGAMFSCRIFDEKFPDIDKLLSVDGAELHFPNGLIEILEKATVFCSDDERVTIGVNGDKMTVYSEGDSGWFKELIRADYKGEPVEFDIAPDFMKSILKITTTGEVTERLLKFTGDNFIHVVALMKGK